MKTSVIIFFIVLNCFGLKAQNAKWPSPEHDATGRVNMLKSILNLANQKTEKVMLIYFDHFKSRDSLKTIIVNRGPNPKTINSNLITMFNAKELETDKKISSVLNKDQKLVFAKFISSRTKAEIVTIATPVSPR